MLVALATRRRQSSAYGWVIPARLGGAGGTSPGPVTKSSGKDQVGESSGSRLEAFQRHPPPGLKYPKLHKFPSCPTSFVSRKEREQDGGGIHQTQSRKGVIAGGPPQSPATPQPFHSFPARQTGAGPSLSLQFSSEKAICEPGAAQPSQGCCLISGSLHLAASQTAPPPTAGGPPPAPAPPLHRETCFRVTGGTCNIG